MHQRDIRGPLNGPMNSHAQVFETHRPRLLAIAIRMLGSRTEAEDILQDAYLRWHESDPAEVQSDVAFLVSMTTRLCIDRIRKLKHERTQELSEDWLPEAVASESFPSPEAQLESSQEVSVALSAVFDRLGREERAAFLLHDVFDYDYPEIARTLGKAQPACRQIVHRARNRVRGSEVGFTAKPGLRHRMLNGFINAVVSGDRKAALSLIETDFMSTDTSGPRTLH